MRLKELKDCCSNKISSLVFTAIFISICSTAFAQVEICNNGIDDDFDGFIDCYDGSCANNSTCDGIFLGNDANCSVPPPAFPAFTMTLDFKTPDNTPNHLSRMAIGDLDRDGMPEFVTMNRYSKKLFILNGNDGSIKREVTAPFEPYWEVAIGNINNDNCAEIFFIGYMDPPGNNNNGIYLFSYDCQLNLLWQSAQRLPGDPINFGLADFDSDGLVELYAKDEIYDAHTGTRIIKSTAANYGRINGGPVAVDIDATDTKLELVLGLRIYSVNLGSRGTDVGSLSLISQRAEYFVRNEYNATSIADFNQDGHLDIIASGSTIGFNTNTTIFYWDVFNNQLTTYRDLASGYGANGWKNGTGRVNIADLDGDGKLNASYVSGRYLYALKEDLTLLWRIVINEETSGYTGCTLFDFNGDGESEIVYRDERFLYIIEGNDGSIYSQVNCSSRTNREYPIVADVDADGSTEICVTCAVTDVSDADFANFVTSGSALSTPGQIRVFKSAAEPWVPARRVWNQHGYFVVNVNDDLTIPKVLQKHQLVFSTGNCTQGPNRPLNKFLNQSPFLNSEGCPTYASPDLAFSIAPTVIPPTCPDLNFTVSFQITNLGDVGLSGNVPVTFYTTNPTLPGATKLNTITLALSNFNPNDVFDVVNATVTGIGSDSLYVVLNDAGTTVPTPISLPNTTFFECDYDNILGVKVIPLPVTITALEEASNQQCSSPANGAARAFIPIGGGGENTADYNFYWSNGTVAKPVGSADFVGPIYTGIIEGTYTVYAIHKTANCSSDTVQVVINAIPSILPAVTITVLSHQTQCNPPNGKLEALVAGGNSGYSFAWFNNAVPLGITTSVASGLIGGNYSVLVQRNGCSVTQNAIVLDNALDPDVTASSTPVVNCQNPTSGTVSASVSISGVPQPDSDYTFDWYFYDNATSTRGSQLPIANGTGPTRTGLAVGHYEVVATNTTSQCASLPIVIEVENQTVIPVVSIAELAPQTSCDPANPNGRLQATVTIGGVPQNPADFTFEWFVGQNTLAANLHPDVSGTNGNIAEKVKGGGQAYTVKATSASQCFATEDAVVSESLINPVVTLTPTPNGICDPALVVGPPGFQGSVSASVSYNGNPVVDFTGYSFEWYNGTQAIGAARPETTSTLTSLNTGFYTLVVTRADNGCAAVPTTAEVLNTTIVPNISTNAIGSTNCDPLLANGQAIVTDVDGAGTGAPYNFKWHTGVDTSTPIAGATNATLSNRQGGAAAFFTVLVTNESNGCQNTETVLVPDSKVIPAVTLAQTPNTICDASLTNPAITFNGTATATVSNLVGPISGYTFTWHNGQLVTDPINATSTNQNLINVNGGYYTTVATQNSTGCVSGPVTVQVINTTNIPVIATNAIGSTNCVPSLANGQALVTDVDGAGTSSPYVFQWHTGNNTAIPIAGATTANLSNRQGGAAAFFTVMVTNESNGCQNTATVLVPDVRVIPSITLAQTPNTVCDASLTNPSITFNGTATATVTNLVGPITGYSFTWHNGQLVTDPVNPSSTNQNLTNINGGYYTTVAEQTATGCVSSPVTVQVIDNTTTPVVNTSAIASTNCLPALANGQAIVTDVDGAGTAAPYVFQWHSGIDTSSPIGSATTPSLTNRQGGVGAFFTVLVTNQSNGCQNTATVEVPNNPSLPVLTLSSTDNENCSAPFNGTASVNTITYQGVPEALTGYSFAWTHGPLTSTASSLGAGTYELTVTRIDVGCTSNPARIDVGNDLYLPVIDVAVTNQTSCDPSNPNGILSASMDETSIGGGASVTAGYTFSWTNDGNPLVPGGPSVGNTSTINALPGNLFYTITVERSITRCTNTQSVFLPERINLPRLELIATDIVDCNTSGFVTARIFIDKNNDGDSNDAGDELTPAEIAADYTIAWFRGTTTAGPQLPETDRILNELSPGVTLPQGNYTAIATNNLTSCQTSDFTDVINGPPTLFNIDFEINNRPASCTNLDGVITAFVDGGGGVPEPFNNYTFQWFQGNPTNGLSVPTPNFYTDPLVQFVSPALDVDPFSVFGTAFPGSPAPQAPTSVNTGPTLFSRASGTYSVVVQDNVTGCKEFKTVFLPFIQEPVIILARIKPDECAGDVGEIEVELQAPFPANNYLLQIYQTPNPVLGTTPVFDQFTASALGNVFDNLASGIYTVVAQEDPTIITSGCYSSPVLVQLVEALPPLVDVTGSGANSTCVASPLAGDGSLQIEISTDSNDPFSISYPLPPPPTILQRPAVPPFVTYSIDVKDAGNIAVPGYPTGSTFEHGDTELINGLRGETYTVTVTSSHGCITTKTFAIPNAPRIADLSSNIAVLPALACDPLLETNASIEVNNLSIPGVTVSDNLSDYQFDWFTDPAFSTNILSANGDNNPAIDGGEVLSNVGSPVPSTAVTAGSYWVRATKVLAGATGGLGCLSAPIKVDIDDQSINPRGILTPFANTACDADFEGSIITQITNPGSIATPNYNYTWTSPVASPIANSISNGDGLGLDDTFAGLSDGIYILTYRNNTSGCIGTSQTTILKAATPIVVTNATAVDQLICNPDGSITVGPNDIVVGGVVDPTHTNFDFTWSRSDAATVVVGPAQNADVLSIANLLTIGADSYFVKVKKRSGLNPGSGCESAPFRVEILDKSVDPTVVLTPFSTTACDANFDGALTVLVTNPGSAPSLSYDYTWISTPVASPIANGTSNGDGLGADDNFNPLSDGVYSVSVRNNVSGCLTTGQTTITKQSTPVLIANATAVDQFICNPDGSITVGPNDILVGGVVDPVHANFDFTWSRGDVATVVVGPTQSEDVLNIANLPTIGADSYFVTVRKRPGLNPGSGCESAPYRVDIFDRSVDPTVVLTPFSTTACDANFDGALTVLVTSPGSAPSLSYDYTWISTPVASPIANGTSNGDGLGADDNFNPLSDGVYSVSVRNNVSGCLTTGQTTITKQSTPVLIANATVVDQLICNPDGSITVGPNDILVGGVVDPVHANFDFTWSRGDVATVVVGPTQSEDVLSIANLPTIGADSYFVQVKKRPGLNPGSGCESVPVRVEIRDLSEVPNLSFTSIIPNSSCNLANPNGFIEATASERSGPVGNYNFVWTFNGGGLPGSTIQGGVSPLSQLTNAGAGQYAVEVTNTLTGCKFDQVLELQTNESLSLPNIVDITVTNPLNCFPQGGAQVVSLTIGGTQTLTNPPDDIDTDYDYEWYKNSIPAGLIAGEQTSTIANQLPGVYYVRVRNLITDCISAAVEAVIDSADIVYPVVSIQQIAPQVICTVNIGSGALSALADGQPDTNPNYTFNWFSNLDLSGPSIATSSTITDLLAGDYSLEVQDLSTNCKASAVFILPENKLDFKPVLAISSNPLTECDTVDGSVYARGIPFLVTTDPAKNYPFTYNYKADLYVGNPPADINNPEFPNMPNDPSNPLLTENYVQGNLQSGLYTVRLTDLNTGCETIDNVSVDDLRKFPVPVVSTISPVTNCDPANPNGVARVTVDGSFIGFDFNWYEGPVVAGVPFYTGAEYSELKVAPQEYTIEAINLVTGCTGTVQATVANGTLPIPMPQIEILSHVTSCVINNGALSVSVGGNTKDYIFDWYDGSAETPPADFIGEIYDSLAAGTYSATATSRITGCKSPLAVKSIEEKKEFPDFVFKITNASCDLSNGFATVIFSSTVGVGSIEWFSDNQLVAVGPNFADAPAGAYAVRVVSELGCETEKELAIIADIRPRNGISRNGDAQNDYFHIDCIDQFESNNVKIFNRAGTLVYEADGYDNSNIFFDGISNRGISPIGNNVPDGTYFFIIDKRDGSKPLAGYLEIVK